jgi:antitoxin component YwqK of YwqJK toxin-antitoxin module
MKAFHNARRWSIGFGVALLLAGGVFLALVPKRESQRSLQPSELLRSELTLHDGRLYRAGDSNAFSGVMIERYAGGTLRSRSEVWEGLLHGVSQGWFTNGQLQVTEHFKKGVSDGLRTKWFSTGKKLSEAHIVDGRFEGVFRKWHENGLLAERVEFIGGQSAGTSVAYFPSGYLKARATLDAGKVVQQTYWKDGESSEKLTAQEGAF